MIDFIEGEIVELDLESCVVLVGGVGYRIYISKTTSQRLMGQKKVRLLTSLQVREDSMTLYGFESADERKLYEMFNTVKGIGPRVALNILSTAPHQQLRNAIVGGDLKFLQQAPGIGKKSAERIVLELKDKVNEVFWEEVQVTEETIVTISQETDELKLAIDGLMGLGYTECEAKAALHGQSKELSAEELLRIGLKSLSK